LRLALSKIDAPSPGFGPTVSLGSIGSTPHYVDQVANKTG